MKKAKDIQFALNIKLNIKHSIVFNIYDGHTYMSMYVKLYNTFYF